MNWKQKLSPGDLIFWTDGTPGILLERFDMYAKPGVVSQHYPCWCWHVAFLGSTPSNYSLAYGAGEINMFNLGMIPKRKR